MSEPNVQEPTMEEILASIRRIISEDEPQGEPTPAEPAPDVVAEVEAEEVLELTHPLPAPEPGPAVVTHRDEAPVAPEPEPVAFAAPLDDEPLVSEPTADEAASAFGQLSRSVGMPRSGRTLEDLVRELLNPLLKAWLDEHLPAIVQAKVEEEVERIARRRVR